MATFVEAVDLGDAPEIFISGISNIEQIGPGTVRFTFYSERENCRRVVLHTIWDLAQAQAQGRLAQPGHYALS
jgi:hypothetical protein